MYAGRSEPELPHHVSLNPSNGNLSIKIAAPRSVFSMPPGDLTYNSRASATNTTFGHGMAELFNSTVTQVSATSARVS